jgi:AcrR family transcriptional regulator
MVGERGVDGQPWRANNGSVSVDRPNEEVRRVGTREQILVAARATLLDAGYASLSTRRVADAAGVPLSQLHYHFGSKQNLVVELLVDENRRLLERQVAMYGADEPLWKRWEQACDFLDDDLRSGYVRVLQEMMAAGWSDPAVAEQVRSVLAAWFKLLTTVAADAEETLGSLGPFTAADVAALAATAFLGSEAVLLLGLSPRVAPVRGALRRVGALIRSLEEALA